MGGYKYKTGGSPLRKDSPDRKEKTRESQYLKTVNEVPAEEKKAEKKEESKK
jgi:hypothetical protein